MGQVPSAKPWLLIGSGRLATHVAHYLRHAGVAHRQWSRAHGLHGASDDTPLDAALETCDRVLLAVADDALSEFAARHRRRDGAPWVHFSGSRVVAGVWSAHPLCTFGPDLYEPSFYPEVPFVVEAEGPALGDLLPGLANPEARLPAADKPLYHALCVAAGNFTTLLWQGFHVELERRWGIPAALARPYLERTAANLTTGAARQALTGPIARRDVETIRRNLEALDRAGLPHLADIYRAFLSADSAVTVETAA